MLKPGMGDLERPVAAKSGRVVSGKADTQRRSYRRCVALSRGVCVDRWVGLHESQPFIFTGDW